MTLTDARTLHLSGDLAGAEAIYRALLTRSPDQAELLFLLGMLLIAKGDPGQAATMLERATALAPGHAKAHNGLGTALAGLGRVQAAAAAFRAALDLDAGMTGAAHNLARLQGGLGQWRQARDLLADIVARAPDNAAAWTDLGTAEFHCRHGQAAEAALRRAVALAGDGQACDGKAADGLATRNLATLFKVQGRSAAADILARRSDDPLARFMAATTMPAILDSADQADRVERRFLAALDDAPDRVVADPLAAFGALGHFHFAYYDRPVLGLHQAAARCYRRLCPSLITAAPAGPPRPRRSRPRVAFVSAHFSNHTIGRLFAGLVGGLAAGPAGRFETVAVLAPGRRDGTTRDLVSRVPAVVLDTDLTRARRQLADLGADVIVYPDLGMDPFTYFLAHARLAPRQITTWGHPVSPGLDSIDAFVGARGLTDAAARADHGERVVDLPVPAFVFDRPAIPARGRADYPLPATGRLYLCPQSPFKLHPGFDPMINAILEADPSGHLVLLAGTVPAHVAALKARFGRSLGQRIQRVCFLPALPRADFLGLLGLGDVMVDIPSFSGGNTTLEALAAGLPVVTLARPTIRGGLSAALLRMAGLGDLIATDADSYVRQAVSWADDGGAVRAAIAAQAGQVFGRTQAAADFADALDQVLAD